MLQAVCGWPDHKEKGGLVQWDCPDKKGNEGVGSRSIYFNEERIKFSPSKYHRIIVKLGTT